MKAKTTPTILRVAGVAFATSLILLQPTPGSAQEGELDTFMSLDSLLNLPVSAASKYSQTSREAAASTSIVTREEIEAFGYESLADVLSQVPGFYRTYDRNYTYVGVRGFGRPGDYNNRILLTIDGHPVNDRFYNSALMGTGFALELDWIERVEVARGPGSALYGTSAVAAVVNLVPKEGAALESFLIRGTAGDTGLRSGSIRYGTQVGQTGDLSLFASVRQRAGNDLYFAEFDDPSTNNGIAESLDTEEGTGFYGRFNLGDLTLSALASSRDKRIPTAPWELNFNDPSAWTKDQSFFVDARWDRQLNPTRRLTVSARRDWSKYRGSYPYEQPYGDFLERSDVAASGADARLIWDLTPGTRLILGSEYVQAERAEYTALDEMDTYFEGNFPYRILSVYAQNEWQIRSDLSLVSGIRFDRFSAIESAAVQIQETATSRPTPRVGLVYHPGESSTIKALYGEAFRVPSRYELHYFDGSTHLANPGLGPERIRTAEIAWEQEVTNNLWFGLSAFDNKMVDLIDEIVTTDDFTQYRNDGNARVHGIEGQLRFQSRSLSGFASAALQSGEVEGPAAESLTNSPGSLLRAGVIYSDKRGVRVGWNVARDGTRITTQETSSWGYTVSNINVSTTHMFAPFHVSVGLRNLFNTRYTQPGGFEHTQATIVQDGRVAQLSLSAIF